MTDHIKALTALLVKVEAGDATISDFAAAIPPHKGYGRCAFQDAWGTYNGSFDAARDLHNAVLPGYSYLVGINWVEVWLPFVDFTRFNVGNSDPARAWLIAIIKALIAKEQANE